jgi:hypothetical protein
MSDVTKKGKGAGSVSDLTLEVLKAIRVELRMTNERLLQTNERLDKGFRELRQRLDHLVAFSGERWQDHEQRIRRLERRITT